MNNDALYGTPMEKILQIRIPEKLHEKLRKHAFKQRKAMSIVVRELIEECVNKKMKNNVDRP